MIGPIDYSRFETALTSPRGWLDLGIVAACCGVAWLIDRQLVARAKERTGERSEARIHLENSFGRVLFSLIALTLLAIGRAVYQALGGKPLFIDIAIPLLIALAVIRMLLYAMRRLFAQAAWLKTSERTVAFTIWTLVVLYFIGVLPEVGRELDAVMLPIGKTSVSVLTIAKGIAAVVLTLIVTLWLSSLLEQRLLNATSLDTNTKALLSKLLRAVLLVVGVLIALQAIGFDLTLLSVFGGALGVGVGLGLQKLAANYISGFIILLERAIRLGDMITVDGRLGRVARVTSRYVVVRSLDGVEAIIPNETLVTTTVLNHTNATHDIRVVVPIQVAYECDLDLACRLMEEAAAGEPRLVTVGERPTAMVAGFADSGINLELVLWVTGPQAGMPDVRNSLNRKIFTAFKAHGVSIPYPRRDIQVIGAPAGVPPAPPAA
ncbi:MAG: mechanosensitive ion channel [Burkholderiales bacterium]